jgi:hypothetical protein
MQMYRRVRMAEKKNITLRVPKDTYREFEEYRKDRGEISKADAGRRLLEAGLGTTKGSEEEEEVDRSPIELVAWAVLAIALAAYMAKAVFPIMALVAALAATAAAGLFTTQFVREIHRRGESLLSIIGGK